MQYLPDPGGSTGGGARKYVGAIAAGYDEKREQSPKWQAEQQIVQQMLDDLPYGSWVLDCPCGTGRFFQFYHDKGFLFRAIDASADMLQIAAQRVVDPMKARLAQGDVRAIGLLDKSIDASVMIRMTRWLSPEDCQLAIKELQRVSRRKIIFTARVANHPYMRPLSLFEAALDGWKIVHNEAGHEPEYRVIELRPSEAA